MSPHIKHLKRAVTDDDVKRLLEIRMRRITKHDADKADNFIQQLEEELKGVQHHLDNLVEYAIDYYKNLKKKYGEGRERKTEIKNFEDINKAKVAVANVKLYVNRNEGFIGTGLRRSDSEFVCDCSDIDDIIVIRKDGTLIVSKISDKQFVGKDILHVNVWKKGDERTIYNLIYLDGVKKYAMVKRFAVTSITRDKEYRLTTDSKNSKILYLTANPNGEAETVKVLLRPRPKVKRLKFDFDFSEVAIKGRGAKGNILTKFLIHKIELKESGVSTLGGRNIWWDDTVQRLNTEGRGRLLGEFQAQDKILSIMESGHYKLNPQTLNTHFDDDMIIIEKYDPNKVYSMVYFDGEKDNFYVKRFVLEPSDKKTNLMSEHEDSKMFVISSEKFTRVNVEFDKRSSSRQPEEVELYDFISVKGQKSLGNRLSSDKVKNVTEIEPTRKEEHKPEDKSEVIEEQSAENEEGATENNHVEAQEEAKPNEELKPTEKKSTGPKAESKELGKETKAPLQEATKSAKSVKTRPTAKEKPIPSPKKEITSKETKKEEPEVKPKSTTKKDDDDDIPPEGPVQITLDL